MPEGEYPLQIGSVTLTAEVSEQPWTRVSENQADGMSSVWTHDDKIGVRIGDSEETGIYVVKLDAEGRVMEVVPEKAVYWKDKQPATICEGRIGFHSSRPRIDLPAERYK